jgi:hypothetical protein
LPCCAKAGPVRADVFFVGVADADLPATKCEPRMDHFNRMVLLRGFVEAATFSALD